MKSYFKRFLSIFLVTVLLLPAFSSWSVGATSEYDLWVDGVRVTSSNYNNVLGDGTVSFDPDNNILRLKGANITNTYTEGSVPAGIYSSLDEYMIIELGGGSTIDVSAIKDSAAIYCSRGFVSFGGKSNLSVKGDKWGIYTFANINVSGASISAEGGDFGIYISGGNLNLLSGQTVAKGNTSAVAVYNGKISLGDNLAEVISDAKISTLKDITDNKYVTFVSDGVVSTHVDIRVPEFGIWLGNTLVDAINYNDIFKDGTASFDIVTNTLTLSGATIGSTKYHDISGATGLFSSVSDLTICLKGENFIRSNPLEDSTALFSLYDVTFIGDGSLSVSAGLSGIVVKGILNVNSGNISVEMDAGDDYGIYAKSINADGGNVSVKRSKYGFYSENGIDVSGGRISAEDCNSSGVFVKEGDLTLRGGEIYAYGSRYGTYIAKGNLTISAGAFGSGRTGNILSPSAVYVSYGGNINIKNGLEDILNGAVPTFMTKSGKRFYGFAVNENEVSEVLVTIPPHKISVIGGFSSVNGKESNKAYADTTVTVTAPVPDEGYEFVGWTSSVAGLVFGDPSALTTTFVMPDEDVVISANYKLRKFDITYDANGGSGSIGGDVMEYGSTVTLGECTFTPPENYVFKHWKVNGVKYNVGDSFTVTEDILIVPVWRHSVKEEVSKIVIDNVVIPVENENPSYDYSLNADAPYTDVDTYWVKVSDGTILTENDTFVCGEIYRFVVKISIDDSIFVFATPDVLEVTVNGENADVSVDGSTLTLAYDVKAISLGGDIIFDLIIHDNDKESAIGLYDASVPDEEIIADLVFGDADIDMGYSFESLNREIKGCTVTESIRCASVSTGDYVLAVYVPGHSPLLVRVSVSGGDITLDDLCPCLMGDTTGDCRLNLLDVSLMMKYAAGWDVECDTVAGDVTRDGKINLMDVMSLMKYLVGWDGITLGW